MCTYSYCILHTSAFVCFAVALEGVLFAGVESIYVYITFSIKIN